ncbi:probable LRR receptor-like serine/threonine-protein kinase At3g47570 [Chenopodium quinoa]|uniref:non-specific serine/threonine protein kinase n=1 Tax=Chenopodium quinoa TaxID=63459 RepID=A0A803MVT8_CHEQI|nr:probable LRR receptor-like serine/threonine-protein kinase At3g47570 [Chenopodium quinoa]
MWVDYEKTLLFFSMSDSCFYVSSLSLHKKHLLFFVMFFILYFSTCAGTTTTSSISSDARGNMTDHFALLALKSKIQRDPNGALNSWNHSLHHCHWEGITCGHRHKRVVLIDLSSRGLVGTISPYIGNLTFLHYIILHNNSLAGSIPAQIGLLLRLSDLSLYQNSLTGAIPVTLSKCLHLEYLDISENNLVGRFPQELSSLSMLKGLYIHSNNLKGPIFRTIQNFTSLEFLSGSFNSFEGTVPETIGQLKNLSFIAFGSNHLTGMVPPSIYNLSYLTVLSFHYNQLHGSLPTNIASTLPRLSILNLGGNQFSGPLPVSLSNLSSLTRLELRKNRFKGKVSMNLRRLKHLQTLLINHNHLGSGDADDLKFVASLVNCSELTVLDVSSNYFGGVLPKSMVNLSTRIRSLGFDNNMLSGEVPVGMSHLFNLVLLNLCGNQLTGTIPTDIGKLHNLGRLDFSSNRLTGTIPESLGNLSKLSELQLYANLLEGTIPVSLGNCQYINFLIMTQNQLTGTIPKELFEGLTNLVELGLAQNHLEGPLPFEVSKQLSLVGLDISNNKLSGKVQSGLASCVSLLYLYMQGNFFHGPIPSSLSFLKSMQELDLSLNKLSGHIPGYFSKFNLTYLNLSYNDFDGEVPVDGIFANESAVSLMGNAKLCGGIFELHLPRCTRKEATKKKLSLKLKLIISCGCAFIGVAILFSLYWIHHKKKQDLSLTRSYFREPFLKVSYNMLLKATDGFSTSNLLGTGTFGSVFKGMLEPNQMVVAVKVLKLQQQGASRSFLKECEALRNIRHRNLVRIITACSSIDFQGNDFKALLYEFLHGGSLESWLHADNSNEILEVGKLTLLQRVNIALDLACALNYLHHGCENSIVHRDLKPSNVLLDNDMVAHVGDFGLARFLPQSSYPNQSSSAGVKGTIGYAAPEYGLGADASTAGDVYSFGILLLEMMTGKRPTDEAFIEGLNLHTYVKIALPDNVMQIVDPSLLDNINYAVSDTRFHREATSAQRMNYMVSVMEIGMACTMESAQDRMSITDAYIKLQSIKAIILRGR